MLDAVDLTRMYDPKCGLWLADDGADTDRGDPLTEWLAVRKEDEHEAEQEPGHKRYVVGEHYRVAVSHVSWFRKRNARADDFNYQVAELLETRPKCVNDHEHGDSCFQTLRVCFLETSREMWVNPAKTKFYSML